MYLRYIPVDISESALVKEEDMSKKCIGTCEDRATKRSGIASVLTSGYFRVRSDHINEGNEMLHKSVESDQQEHMVENEAWEVHSSLAISGPKIAVVRNPRTFGRKQNRGPVSAAGHHFLTLSRLFSNHHHCQSVVVVARAKLVAPRNQIGCAI